MDDGKGINFAGFTGCGTGSGYEGKLQTLLHLIPGQGKLPLVTGRFPVPGTNDAAQVRYFFGPNVFGIFRFSTAGRMIDRVNQAAVIGDDLILRSGHGRLDFTLINRKLKRPPLLLLFFFTDPGLAVGGIGTKIQTRVFKIRDLRVHFDPFQGVSPSH